MSGKLMYFKEDARSGMKRGIDKLVSCVRETMGGKGKYIALGQPFGSPLFSKDGLYIAKEVFLDDPLEQEGCKLVLEAINNTVKVAGDGGTQTSVLTQALVEGGLKAITSGCNPKDVIRGMNKAIDYITLNLRKNAIPVKGEAIKNVATISANNDVEIGALIAEAVSKTGVDGLVTMKDSSTRETYIEFAEGLAFDSGFASPFFATNPQTMESEQYNPLVLLCDCKITNFNDIIPALEAAIEAQKELFIMCEDIDPTVLSALINNRRQPNGVRSVVAIAPGFDVSRTNFLNDIAAVTGATVVSEDLEMKLSDVTLSMMGHADQVVSHRDYVRIIGGRGKSSDIKNRISEIKAQLKLEKEEHIKKKYKARLAKLSGGVATIFVGASTASEQSEKRDRVEDSIEATRAAIEEGTVAGGGVSLLRCAEGLNKLPYDNEDERTGINIVMKASEVPIRQILENAGLDVSLIVGKVKEQKGDYGYNVVTDQYENFFSTGVIDPAKVTRVALEYSVSIASMVMMTQVVIIDKPKQEQEVINTGGGLF